MPELISAVTYQSADFFYRHTCHDFVLSTQISHFEYLVNVEKLPWGMEAALRGATERLVPILMTALVTALGLLPLALGSGEAGREIEGPMAIVILGGLVTSTALNLLVLPTLALRYGKLGGISSADGNR